ncbi:MAG: hypothetical protein M3178_05095 [Pseudomonadota bacterium]|nr:hypothetical protein [Pseudomonadota bacterium]
MAWLARVRLARDRHPLHQGYTMKAAGREARGIAEIAPHLAARAFRQAQEKPRLVRQAHHAGTAAMRRMMARSAAGTRRGSSTGLAPLEPAAKKFAFLSPS